MPHTVGLALALGMIGHRPTRPCLAVLAEVQARDWRYKYTDAPELCFRMMPICQNESCQANVMMCQMLSSATSLFLDI